jgi:hypothetical protein
MRLVLERARFVRVLFSQKESGGKPPHSKARVAARAAIGKAL